MGARVIIASERHNLLNQKWRAFLGVVLVISLFVLAFFSLDSAFYRSMVSEKPITIFLFPFAIFGTFRWSPSILDSLRAGQYILRFEETALYIGGQGQGFSRELVVPLDEVSAITEVSGVLSKFTQINLHDGRTFKLNTIFSKKVQSI
jgi:hypothetical protein